MYFIILRTLSSINPNFIKNNDPKLVYMRWKLKQDSLSSNSICVYKYHQTSPTYGVSAHGPEVWGKGKEGQSVEKGPVYNAVRKIFGGQQHHK